MHKKDLLHGSSAILVKVMCVQSLTNENRAISAKKHVQNVLSDEIGGRNGLGLAVVVKSAEEPTSQYYSSVAKALPDDLFSHVTCYPKHLVLSIDNVTLGARTMISE